MFLFNNSSELDNIFGVKGIETRGDRKGKIYKYNNFYIKIYDDPKKEAAYIVQVFFYGEDTPIVEESVPHNKIDDFVKPFLI